MSKCMTIDETVDQKDTCIDIAPKEIVEFILEEALLSAFIVSDKGCSRIGDSNITDEFRQQYDQISNQKDFEQVEPSQGQPTATKNSNLNFRESLDRAVPTKGNLELIIDSFVKKEEKTKPLNEYQVISEEVLADNELQIKNGQIHSEKNKIIKSSSTLTRQEYFDKKDVIKDEKIEIEYFNKGQLSKIYVPLNLTSNSNIDQRGGSSLRINASEEKKEKDGIGKVRNEEDTERPFKPYTTEEVREVWENGNSSLVGRWEGDMLSQREEVVRIMEELSSVQVYPDSFVDPNRPRACAFHEEDVIKMTKEIEEINFTQSRTNSENSDLSFLPDGQGDADVESDNLEKSQNEYSNDIMADSNQDENDDPENDQKQTLTLEEEIFNQTCQISPAVTKVAIFGEKNCYNLSFSDKQYEAMKTAKENQFLNDSTLYTKSQCEKKREIFFNDPSKLKESNSIKEFISESMSLPKNIETLNENAKIEFSLKNPDLFPKLGMLHRYLSSLPLRDTKLFNQTCQISPAVTNTAIFGEKNCDNLSFNDKQYEAMKTAKENQFLNDSTLYTKSQCEKKREIFLNDPAKLKESNSIKEFISESMSLPKNIETLNENAKIEFSLKNPDLFPKLENKLIQEELSHLIKEPSNVKDSQGSFPELNRQIQQGAVIRNKPNRENHEAVCSQSWGSFLEEKHGRRLVVDCITSDEDAEEEKESKNAENFFQESYPQFHLQLEECKSNSDILKNGEDNLNEDKINEITEENFETLEKQVVGDESELIQAKKDEKFSINGTTFEPTETPIDEQKSKKYLTLESRLSNTESNQESPPSSQSSQTQINEQPATGKELSEASEFLVNGSQKFKLHSQKMYFSLYNEPVGQVPNEFNLTESEEAFIDVSENVIQIIEPLENHADEDSNAISFSLLPETSNLKSATPEVETESQFSLERKESSESETPNKKIYSGMTTIGPIKNIDYDPKDLMAPEIDYGKMTRITSSRQLARDMGLLNSDLNTTMSIKIVEEDNSDDSTSLNIEDDHTDRTSLVNRDIASLTKVQKVREVMSYQAKPEEDFEDEEALPRPRLDLKDVESLTDERYKFPDVSIPLLSVEIGERNSDVEKELMESMGLVISGLTNVCFYDEDTDYTENQRNNLTQESRNSNSVELLNDSVIVKQNTETELLDVEEKTSKNIEKEKNKVEFAEKANEESSEKELLEAKRLETDKKDSQDEGLENSKYSTLGNVFRKASSKFMKKDSETYIRNSKSLPREANKTIGANSIRSILDDCQSSASNMLKKSCSLLKNTESIFKSISQSMVVTSDKNSDTNTNQKKLSPSESDVSTIERKFSGFFKKEDFTKAKNLIKSKVEKTFKNSETISTLAPQPEISSEKKNLQLIARNEENLRIDRIENFKKLLPKSPLVYKSQFVKSQMSFQSPPEKRQLDETAKDDSVEKISDSVPEKKIERQEEAQPTSIFSQENVQWITKQDDLQSPAYENLVLQQPNYIVMETIEGLPASDLESPSSEKENLNVENTGEIKKGSDLKKVEASYSVQIFTDNSRDVAVQEADEEKTVTKIPSERKIKTQKKKFTARFRSFWCSAFGRAKTPHKKGDLS